MSGYDFRNPIIKTKILTYERLAWQTKDVWFREYLLFGSKDEIEEDLSKYENSRNIRNAEVYDIVIDLRKPVQLPYLNHGNCYGCMKGISYNNEKDRITLVNGHWYCSYDCFCEHNPDKVNKKESE